jgi:hypothetical protein
MSCVGFLVTLSNIMYTSKASLHLNTTTQYTQKVNDVTYIGKKIKTKMTTQFIFIFKDD